ncbi:MAG: phospholipase D-like domain-containing protein [Bryobacteraceae bacterium]
MLPLVKAICAAKSCIEIVIFRFDQREVERALANAVSRGVSVHALIASTNSAGAENLRRLELRLLAAGITAARTADDLVRYHSKVMIVDRRDLYLLAFNWTHLDIDRSRSFGLIVKNRDVVREVEQLFAADTKRIPYEPSLDSVVVSPVNARKALAKFIQEAKKDLIVYDPKISDRAMIRLLAERAKAGVNVRIIGRLVGQVPRRGGAQADAHAAAHAHHGTRRPGRLRRQPEPARTGVGRPPRVGADLPRLGGGEPPAADF